MTRGNKITRQSIFTACLLCILATPALAGSTGRALENPNGKIAAPTKEDSAAYFSTAQKGVSPEAERAADTLRLKTMSQIRSLLDKSKGKNEFELWLRLGELQVERADYLRDIEIQQYVTAHDTWQAADPKTRGKSPEANYKNSETELHNGVNSFRRLVNKYPKHPRTDAALYSLAKTLSRLEDDNALQYYKQLLQSHPKSPLIPDTWLAIGEFYFDKHKIPEASDAYQHVMNFKTHRAYPFAVYKLGWCYYNTIGGKDSDQSIGKAITAFKLVVKLSDKKKTGNFNLRDEAIRDLVMVFAETEDVDAAWKYFKTIGEEDKFYVMLERLGNIYADAGKDEKAVEVFTRLVTEVPARPANPKTYQRLVELYDSMNRFPQVVSTIQTMHTLYVEKNSKWIAANLAKKDILADGFNITERTTHRFGTMFHSRGQKAKNPTLEGHAAKIYEMYLASFPATDAAYDIRYYLADIQMNENLYEAASVNFMGVAKQRPKNGTHLKEAALLGVTAIAKLNDTMKSPALPPPGQVPKPIEIPHIKKLYADTIDMYVSILPGEKDGQPMRFTAAQIYFDYGQYPEAVKRFDTIATQLSSTKQGTASARIVIAYFNEKSDWTNVITYGKKYQGNTALMADAPVKKFVEDSLRSAIFNSAMASEKAKDYEQAAASFLEYRKMFPADPNADRALYNASVNFFRAGRIEDALDTQKALLSGYPKSTLGADVTANMGETYEALAKFQSAADTYKKFAQSWPADKRAPHALFNAGILYKGVKQPDSAASMFVELYKKYPTIDIANDALFEGARIKEAMSDKAGAAADYHMFAAVPANKNKDDGIFAAAKSIELQLGTSKNDAAQKELAKISMHLRAKGSPAAPEGRRVVAGILFQAQEPGQKAFKDMTLNDGNQIEKQVKAKQAKLESLANAYEEIMAIGNGEYSVASLYRLGELHEDFSKALFNAPAPSGLSQQETNAFKSQLEKVGFPLKEEAYKFFDAAYKRSQEVETFTTWTSKTYTKMVELAPEKHPEVNEQSAVPTYMSHKVSMSKATEHLAH